MRDCLLKIDRGKQERFYDGGNFEITNTCTILFIKGLRFNGDLCIGMMTMKIDNRHVHEVGVCGLMDNLFSKLYVILNILLIFYPHISVYGWRNIINLCKFGTLPN